MSQKSRNEVTSVFNTNIYNNKNNEIDYLNVLTVLNEIRDSFFNLKDDLLKDLKYNQNQTLEQYINSLIGAVPFWGTTGYFDVGSNTGDIQDAGIDAGIVTDIVFNRISDKDSEVIINLSENIADRKLAVNLFTDASINNNNDLCAPIIKRNNSKQISVGLREVTRTTQKVRIEILAYKTVN